MGLRYDPGPKLDFHLRTLADVERTARAARRWRSIMQFQADAMKLTRARLRADKGLIGFVGGPFTLYVYAAAGSHESAAEALAGLDERRLRGVQCEAARPARRTTWRCSRTPAPKCVALFDTAAGEIDAATYGTHVVPVLADLLAALPQARCHHAGHLLLARHGPGILGSAHGSALPVPGHRLAARHRPKC